MRSDPIDEQKLRILEAEEQRLIMEKAILRAKLNTSDSEQKKEIEMKLEEIDQKLTDIKNKKQRLQGNTQSLIYPTYEHLNLPTPFLKSLYTLSMIISLYV